MAYIIEDFLDEIYDNCNYVSFLSVRHILNKIYNDIENKDVTKDELLTIIQDYSLILRYLNDFSSVIYRQHNSSVQIIYDELCDYFNLTTDNKFTFNHIVAKLQKQTPVLLMSLSDEDIKLQTIQNYCKKLDNIKKSLYYQDNIEELKSIIDELDNNINLVKIASQIT